MDRKIATNEPPDFSSLTNEVASSIQALWNVD
jgi:hypothetical protein